MALSRYHGIAEDKQVLLAHDGRLLEHQQMIGAYGVGTVGVVHSSFLYDMLLTSWGLYMFPHIHVSFNQ